MADAPIEPDEMIAAYRAVARPSSAVKRRIAGSLAHARPSRARVWPFAAIALAAAALLVFAWTSADDGELRDRSGHGERLEAPYEGTAPVNDGELELSPESPRSERVPVTEVPLASSVEQALAGDGSIGPKRHDTRPPASSAPTEGNDLRAEMALLERARVELRAEHHREALTIVERHARDFSNGALVEEREALRVLASCGLPERATSARAAQRAFLRRFAGSTYADRVRSACADGDEATAESHIP